MWSSVRWPCDQERRASRCARTAASPASSSIRPRAPRTRRPLLRLIPRGRPDETTCRSGRGAPNGGAVALPRQVPIVWIRNRACCGFFDGAVGCSPPPVGRGSMSALPDRFGCRGCHREQLGEGGGGRWEHPRNAARRATMCWLRAAHRAPIGLAIRTVRVRRGYLLEAERPCPAPGRANLPNRPGRDLFRHGCAPAWCRAGHVRTVPGPSQVPDPPRPRSVILEPTLLLPLTESRTQPTWRRRRRRRWG